MAALASSAVSLYPTAASASEYYPGGRDSRSIVKRRLKLVLTGQGGLTNTIPASALGVRDLIECSALWDATNSKGYPAVVDPVNDTVVLLDGAAAPAPVDVTSTATYITITGFTL